LLRKLYAETGHAANQSTFADGSIYQVHIQVTSNNRKEHKLTKGETIPRSPCHVVGIDTRFHAHGFGKYDPKSVCLPLELSHPKVQGHANSGNIGRNLGCAIIMQDEFWGTSSVVATETKVRIPEAARSYAEWVGEGQVTAYTGAATSRGESQI
jgi:hypothetical protein